MKYCVSGRHQYSVLRKADEVRVKFEDKARIMDFIENIPDKTIILDMPNFDVDYDTWHMYDDKFEGGFYLALHILPRAQELNEQGIKWYWPYPITSFYELHEILALGPSYVMIGAPLSFDLDEVVKVTKDVPIRMTCNCARPVHLFAGRDRSGLKGQWVRPEDVAVYESRVSVFEFDGVEDSLQKEETLLRIYQENKEWPGNLNLLITHFNINVDNRAIDEDIGTKRMNCGQRCLRSGSCHFCENAILFAEQVRKIHNERRKQAAIDNN